MSPEEVIGVLTLALVSLGIGGYETAAATLQIHGDALAEPVQAMLDGLIAEDAIERAGLLQVRLDAVLGTLKPSAHSFANGYRWWNRRKLRLWQSAVDSGRPPIEGGEELSPEQLALEAMMLGLRTTDGVELTEIHERYGIDLQADNVATIDRLCASGHLRLDGDHLRPTLAGFAIADTGLATCDDRGTISPSRCVHSRDLDSRAARASDRLGVGAAES